MKIRGIGSRQRSPGPTGPGLWFGLRVFASLVGTPASRFKVPEYRLAYFTAASFFWLEELSLTSWSQKLKIV